MNEYEQINKVVEAKHEVVRRIEEAANQYVGMMIEPYLQEMINHSVEVVLYDCLNEELIPGYIWQEPIEIQSCPFHHQIAINLPFWLVKWLQEPPGRKVEEILEAPERETEPQRQRRFEMNVVLADIPSIDDEES